MCLGRAEGANRGWRSNPGISRKPTDTLKDGRTKERSSVNRAKVRSRLEGGAAKGKGNH